MKVATKKQEVIRTNTIMHNVQRMPVHISSQPKIATVGLMGLTYPTRQRVVRNVSKIVLLFQILDPEVFIFISDY
jgi:hypothetical protein